jgi:hypothetical protein
MIAGVSTGGAAAAGGGEKTGQLKFKLGLLKGDNTVAVDDATCGACAKGGLKSDDEGALAGGSG